MSGFECSPADVHVEKRVLRITFEESCGFEVRVALGAFELRGPAWKWIRVITAYRQRGPDGWYEPATTLDLRGVVVRRGTDEPIEVRQTVKIADHVIGERHALAYFLRSFVTSAVVHELDESLFLGGALIRDPHAGDL